MRALWTAATGMKNLQLAIDNTSNNISNVNTTGYKSQRTEFKDLMYARLSYRDNSDKTGVPVGLEVGHGVRSAAIVRNFMKGSIKTTQNPYDVAIDGRGFFEVLNASGEPELTRDGSFKLGLTEDGLALLTADGYKVQGREGDIIFEGEFEELKIELNGTVKIRRPGDDAALFEIVGRIKILDVPNPSGLVSVGSNQYISSPASGETFLVENPETKVLQNALEMSNVQVVDEMVNLITQQRAYEINSKAIQTADRMLEIANNLKR